MIDVLFAILFAVLPPCTADDGGLTACKWDAGVQGNGSGGSFIFLGQEAVYEVY